MNEQNFTPEELELIKLSDADYKRIIAVHQEGKEFDKDFIRSLNLDDSKRTCLDYNDDVKRLKYYQERVKSFSDYMDTVKSWY